MTFNSHDEEERLLRKAKELRKQAQAMREARLKERDALSEAVRKQQEANAKAEAERRLRIEAEAKRKKERDEEIRAFLLPLTESFTRTGWRIKPLVVTNRTAPVLRIYRSNSYPSEMVEIYWKEAFGQTGFYWE